MKKILFVEDQPDFKLEELFDWLKLKNIKVEYEIVGSVTEAKRYLWNKSNKVDLVITDLGLPHFKGERVTNLLEGMTIVYDMWEFNTEVPVIINSTTVIPNFHRAKEEYEERGQELYKVDSIMEMEEWLIEFLKTIA